MSGVGLLSSTLMEDVPLHNYKDENWALQEKKVENTEERLAA